MEKTETIKKITSLGFILFIIVIFSMIQVRIGFTVFEDIEDTFISYLIIYIWLISINIAMVASIFLLIIYFRYKKNQEITEHQ